MTMMTAKFWQRAWKSTAWRAVKAGQSGGINLSAAQPKDRRIRTTVVISTFISPASIL